MTTEQTFPFDGVPLVPRERWHDAVRAASLLMHALDARTSTQAGAALGLAGDRLDAAGLTGLAYEAWEMSAAWDVPDADIQGLLAAVERACERLKAETSLGEEAA